LEGGAGTASLLVKATGESLAKPLLGSSNAPPEESEFVMKSRRFTSASNYEFSRSRLQIEMARHAELE
jgi:hypothetical protein